PEKELKDNYPFAYEYLLKVKPLLDKRDNGKPNPVAWYAFGRTQGLDTTFGKKILFSPMNKQPNFILSENKETTFYSGYCIKYDGDYEYLLKQLNSKRMKDYIQTTARDFRGGWKAYNKKIVQEFIIE
ncbi:MAG: N-6 DNA methylase, partial [Candidatus Cloacimonadota bacterium]